MLSISRPTFRYYQNEAHAAIHAELVDNGAEMCLVKMFCGTGKSPVMRYLPLIDSSSSGLFVYVFPSLALIKQFCDNYLNDVLAKFVLRVSSDGGDSTTDIDEIQRFLAVCSACKRFVCVTYQSFGTLLTALNGTVMSVCSFDEAHHAVGETYQKLIFSDGASYAQKRIFYTATPVNDNGIVMYRADSKDADSVGHCGKMVYDYPYLSGVRDGYLNTFEIVVDLYTDNNVRSIYASIARAILSKGNNRVLTFHADVNSDRDNAVKNFVREDAFVAEFNKVVSEEFPSLAGKYKKITFWGLYAEVGSTVRDKMLDVFDKTGADEIIILSSCETIGEGIDTKRANMCVFADPKSSYTKIIQNIGRIVRKPDGTLWSATILIPCWVDKTRYVDCADDKEKCDAAIRADLAKQGNFNAILNVMSALRQDSEELYELCLHYPDAFSRTEVDLNLHNQGFEVGEKIGEGGLEETLEALGSVDIESDDVLEDFAERNGVNVEVHSTDFERPVERYSGGSEATETVRLFKETCESENSESEEDVYYPIQERETKRVRTDAKVEGLNKKKRTLGLDIHSSSDILVLWGIKDGVSSLGSMVKQCVIDCEVTKYDPMEVAEGIVKRAKAREARGENLLPKVYKNVKNRNTPEKVQQAKDHQKISDWKKALKGKRNANLPINVKEMLDKELTCWRDEQDLEELAYNCVEQIIQRAKERQSMGLNLIPIRRYNAITELEKQETKDSYKLADWKKALKGKGDQKCYPRVKELLDLKLPGWNDERNLEELAYNCAEQIIQRAEDRQNKGLNIIPICHNKLKQSYIEKQETKDAYKLSKWKKAIKGKGHQICYPRVKELLDSKLIGWTNNLEDVAYNHAEQIVERAEERQKSGLNFIPFKHHKPKTELEKQETKDAQKLGIWKKALKCIDKSVCYPRVKELLNRKLPGWDFEQDLKKMAYIFAEQIIERAEERKRMGLNMIPTKRHNPTTELDKQETKDAQKLGNWKKALNGKNDQVCFPIVKELLDSKLPGWDFERNLEENAKQFAIQIIQRANTRKENGLHSIPKRCRLKISNDTQIQENKDFQKLSNWKKALNGKNDQVCFSSVKSLLDAQLPGWYTPSETETPTDSESASSPEQSNSVKRRTTKKATLNRQTYTPAPSSSSAETPEQTKQRVTSQLTTYHQRFIHMRSDTLAQHFRDTPDEFHTYHRIREENFEKYEANDYPHQRIINELTKIRSKRTQQVLDLGCGLAKIAKHFAGDIRFAFTNYDHVACDQSVTARDISQLPQEDHSVDICILSCALWGTNYRDSITEAHRVLETRGTLFLIDSTSRWSTTNEQGVIEPGMEATKLRDLLVDVGFQIVQQAFDKWCLFVCVKA